MKNIWLILLLGCSGPNGSKDCLIQTVGFSDAMRSSHKLQHRWNRVLVMYWHGVRVGHAIVVFESPTRGLIASDNKKASWTLTMDRSLKDYPRILAELYAPGTDVREAYFFE